MFKNIALILALVCSIHSINLDLSRKHKSKVESVKQNVPDGCIQIFRHCPAGQDYSEIICDDKDNLDSIGGVSGFYLSNGLIVTFYTQANFQGTSVDYSSNSNCLAQEGQWNDRFYSVRLNKPKQLDEGCVRLVRHCPQSDNYDEIHCGDTPSFQNIGGLSGIFYGPNTKATFFTAENYAGDQVAIDSNVDCLAWVGPWNDRLNSFKINKPKPVLSKGCVEIIRHCPGGDNFSKIYCDDQPELDEIQGVSGIHFGAETNVIFYSDRNFEGTPISFTKDVDCLATDGPWNDRINSFKILADNNVPVGCIKLIRHCPGDDNYNEIVCEDRDNLDSIQGLSGYILGAGANVDFFSERNFRGEKVHALGEDLCLATSGPWNDQLNSLRISKDAITSTNDC